MWIHWFVRLCTIGAIAGLPLVIGLPCLCCVPKSRKTVLTIGCGWAVLYSSGMTLGPRATVGWIAWGFSELWLVSALKVMGWLVFYGVKVLGLFLSKAGNILILSFIIWVGWNLHHWLDKRQPRPRDEVSNNGDDDREDLRGSQ